MCMWVRRKKDADEGEFELLRKGATTRREINEKGEKCTRNIQNWVYKSLGTIEKAHHVYSAHAGNPCVYGVMKHLNG